MAKKAILKSKRTSWKTFVEEIMYNTLTATVWKRFKAIGGKSYKPIQHIRDDCNNIVTDPADIAYLFNKTCK